MRQAFVVSRQKARQRFVERCVDTRGRDDALHQRRGAGTDHAGDDVIPQRASAVAREHRIGAVGEIAARVDERAIQVEHNEFQRGGPSPKPRGGGPLAVQSPSASPPNVANDVGVSHTVTRTTGNPCECV